MDERPQLPRRKLYQWSAWLMVFIVVDDAREWLASKINKARAAVNKTIEELRSIPL